MSDLTWLFIALSAVWVGIGGYLMSIVVRQRNLERRVRDLASHAPDDASPARH